MRIFIDESGLFVPVGDGRPKAQAVGALVVPSAQSIDLLRAYKKLRKRLRPLELEMKGSTISEAEAASLIEMCRGYDVLLRLVIMDVGAVSGAVVRGHRDAQADKIIEHITRDHYASLVHELVLLQRTMRSLPPQLYLQAFALMHLIPEVFQLATLYFVQRRPRELGDFLWQVDGKNASVTEAERLWSTLLLPIMQTTSRSKPFVMLEGADYSSFEEFTAPLVDYAGNPLPENGTDLRRVIGDHLQFQPSNSSLGLQLVDNLVSLASRALNGKIAEPSAAELGRLMPSFQGQAAKLITPGYAGEAHTLNAKSHSRWIRVIESWNSRAKGIVLRSSSGGSSERGAEVPIAPC